MGFVDEWPSRMQGQWFLQARNNFRSGLENQDSLDGHLPLHESTSLENFFWGGGEFNVLDELALLRPVQDIGEWVSWAYLIFRS
jgi:hypothetical protein